MVTRDTHFSSLPLTDRLWFRMALLFGAAFFAAFVVSWAYGAISSYRESREAELILSNQPAPIVIDPKLQTDLAKVIAFDSIPDDANFRDPFVDRGGISSNVKLNAAVQQTSATSGGTTGRATSAGTVFNGSRQVIAGNAVPIQDPASVEATRARLADRDERIRAGLDVGPESAAFAIEDLLPVGVVSGGSAQEEVMFYSQSADRTVSFPVGTRFFNGWLAALRPEGVVFNFDDQFRTSRLKSWGRSIKSITGDRLSAIIRPESAWTGVND